MDVSLIQTEITVLDFETTGSVCGYPTEPWQIGIVVLKNGRLDASTMYDRFIRIDPGRPFNPHAPGRHALLRDQIAEAPPPAELWAEIEPWLIGRPLCAHNVATEKKMLRSMAPMHRFGPWIDTLKLARKAWPGCASYALDDLVEQLGLRELVERLCPGREAHDALYDAVASAVLLEHLIGQPGWDDLTLEELTIV